MQTIGSSAGTGVLEYGPTEILPPVRAVSTVLRVSADRATCSRPNTRGKPRLLDEGRRNPLRDGLDQVVAARGELDAGGHPSLSARRYRSRSPTNPRAEPEVRIQFPPVGSLRTIGSAGDFSWGASSAACRRPRQTSRRAATQYRPAAGQREWPALATVVTWSGLWAVSLHGIPRSGRIS